MSAETDIPVDRLVSVYLKIRETKRAESAAAKERDRELDQQMRQVEAELLRRQHLAGTTGFTVKGVGTTYVAEEMKVSIADEVGFLGFCRTEPDGLEFMQHRVATKHLTEWMKDNPERSVPGLNIHRELRVRVRTARSKGTPNAADPPDEGDIDHE